MQMQRFMHQGSVDMDRLVMNAIMSTMTPTHNMNTIAHCTAPFLTTFDYTLSSSSSSSSFNRRLSCGTPDLQLEE
jgi:hypothetical protein